MARAVLGLLQHKFQTADGAELLFHPFGLMANDQQAPLRLQIASAG